MTKKLPFSFLPVLFISCFNAEHNQSLGIIKLIKELKRVKTEKKIEVLFIISSPLHSSFFQAGGSNLAPPGIYVHTKIAFMHVLYAVLFCSVYQFCHAMSMTKLLKLCFFSALQTWHFCYFAHYHILCQAINFSFYFIYPLCMFYIPIIP